MGEKSRPPAGLLGRSVRTMAAMLRDSEERYLAVFMHSDMGIALVEPSGRFLQANPAWLSMTGYAEADLTGLTFQEILHPEERESYADDLRRLWEGEVRSVPKERRCRLQGGGWLSVHLTLSLIQPADGHPPYLMAHARSLSEQKRAEASARHKEQLYRLVAENASDLIALHALDGRYIYASPSAEMILGFTPDELISSVAPVRIHPEDAEVVRTAHAEALQGKAQRVYYRIRRKSGDFIWLETLTQPVLDENGQVVQLQTCSRDITARVQAEEALRESEQRYRALFENTMDAAFVTRPADGSIVAANAAAARMTGWTAEELATLRRDDILDMEDPRLQALFRERTRLGRCQGEVTGRRKDGTTYPAELASSLYHDAGGLKASVLIRDITQRKRDEERLARYAQDLAHSNQELQSLIRHMAEGVLAVDDQHRLMVVNPAASRLVGVPAVHIGQEAKEPLLPGALVEALEEAAATHESSTTFTFGDLELRVHAAPVSAGGAVALLQDVTAEVQLKRLRESFLADASHELRGPLTSLTAVMEAIRDGVIPQGGQSRYIEQALAELRRLRRLVDDLLELSKMDQGIVRVSPVEFDLRPLCLDMLERWKPRCVTQGIQIEVDCPPTGVFADYDRVQQILTNFISNAVRFTPQGGRIYISARPEGKQVRVAVTDSGVGIEAKHLPFIWDRFYKVDTARTRTGDAGTGLGLSIVKQLVEWLGGEVAVHSEPLQGSTFSFTLPAASQ